MRGYVLHLLVAGLFTGCVRGQNNDNWTSKGIPVLVDGVQVLIGGCPQDTLKLTKLEIDGRTVDPNSAEAKTYLKEREKDRFDDMVMETRNMDSLLVKMNTKLKLALPDDRSRMAYDREFELWLRARDTHCGVLREDLSLEDQGPTIECRRWITVCRIGEMPAVWKNWIDSK